MCRNTESKTTVAPFRKDMKGRQKNIQGKCGKPWKNQENLERNEAKLSWKSHLYEKCVIFHISIKKYNQLHYKRSWTLWWCCTKLTILCKRWKDISWGYIQLGVCGSNLSRYIPSTHLHLDRSFDYAFYIFSFTSVSIIGCQKRLN